MDPNAYWNERCKACTHIRLDHHSGSILEGRFGPCKGCRCPAFVDRLKGDETDG